jgi:hypothetical protein
LVGEIGRDLDGLRRPAKALRDAARAFWKALATNTA